MRSTLQLFLNQATPSLLTLIFISALISINSPRIQAESLALEEIVVTVQKRMESINDIPIAITAFGEKMLENASIVSVTNIAQMTPGLALSSYNKTTPAVYIRGIGTNNSHVADDPSVSIFIDDVYISRPGSFDTQLFDLQRIEVLRGPQGTLWGKNVAGGAIVMVTRQPGSEFEGRLSATTGNYNLQQAGFYFNGPLNDKLMGKIAGSQSQRDGYIENSRIGGDVNNADVTTFRGALLWKPNEHIDVQWNLDQSKDDNNGTGRVALAAKPGPASFFPTPEHFNNYAKTSTYTNGLMERDAKGSSLQLNYEVDDTKFTSITAYRDNDYTFVDPLLPFDITPFVPLGFPEFFEQFATNSAEEHSKQRSQEFRMNRYQEEWGLDWTIGLYYFADDIKRSEYLAGQADASNETTSKAVFAQLTKALGAEDQWNLTLGARYTDEKKRFEQLTVGADAEEDWSNTSLKFSLDYSGWDQGMVYLSYAEGFKSGAFNAFASTAAQAETPLDPELSEQVELGVKLHWLQRSLRTNLVIFHTQYEDIQIFDSQPDLTFFIVNATATSKGAELDINYQPVSGLELFATYAYLDATYDEYITQLSDFSGNRLQRAPKHSYTAGAEYNADMSNGIALVLRTDLIYQDQIFYSSSNNANAAGNNHTLINLRASMTLPDKHWQISVWGKNITNEDYIVFENDLAQVGLEGFRSSIPGAPRTYGVTLDYYF
ncbi:TonB-dependent receptor [Oceanicoccus sp. KOV_DT_Chl]|uniref:TonB-dependent receptor n=1 Tax=Oceanicoccus sp. KOV_DT_Chl TaxID=1904639 RepID=UPI0013578ED0|nr:TonB-dependent receptor [Oceanicoccus sp. KOV_DT_Chl]